MWENLPKIPWAWEVYLNPGLCGIHRGRTMTVRHPRWLPIKTLREPSRALCWGEQGIIWGISSCSHHTLASSWPLLLLVGATRLVGALPCRGEWGLPAAPIMGGYLFQAEPPLSSGLSQAFFLLPVSSGSRDSWGEVRGGRMARDPALPLSTQLWAST